MQIAVCGKYIIPDLCDLLNVSINEFVAGERIETESFCEQVGINIIDILQNNDKLRKQKFFGGGTGLILLVLYAPDTAKKAIIVIVGCAMIGLGWYIRVKIEKTKIPLR